MSVLLSVLAFLVAVAAIIVSIYSIRRDAPALRLAAQDAAAGSRFVQVVNVGLQPVRLERITVRPVTWRRHWERSILVPFEPIGGHFQPLPPFQPGHAAEMPRVVLKPGEDVLLRIGIAAVAEALGDRPYRVIMEDAAGREFGVRVSPRTRWDPPTDT